MWTDRRTRAKVRQLSLVVLLIAVASLVPALACAAKPATTASTLPFGGAGVNSDGAISGDIKAIRKEASGYLWEVDVLILSSQDVGSLPNPTKDKIGQVITLKSDIDMTAFKTSMKITARVKYVGDVPKPGISLYIYDIARA